MAPETPTGPIVDVSADNLRVIVRGHFALETIDDAVQSIEDQLRKLGVCEEAVQTDVEALLRQWLQSEEERVTQILFEGTPPGPAQDGRLEWARDFFVTGFELDAERDAMDYRRRLDERSVSKDELLCTLTEAVDGTPGIDVFGQPIRGPKAKRARIRLGPNVTSPDGHQYFAACAGRIRWHRATLSVDDVYVVDGSVNLRTGNIRHPGTLVVYRDIERDSVVIAEKDVDVRGMIDGGSVQAGGDITVHGGIVGHGQSTVEAGGTVRASYILDARVQAKEDIYVGREIVQSRVSAQGSIHVSQGRIVGGVVSAGTEIVVGELGTEAAVKTAVHVNEPEEAAAYRRKIEKHLSDLKQQHDQLQQVVAKLDRQAADLPKDKRAALDKLSAQLENIADEREQCGTELEEFLANQPPPDSRSIRVLRRLHAETSININGENKKVAHGIDGPLTVRNRGDEVRIFAD